MGLTSVCNAVHTSSCPALLALLQLPLARTTAATSITLFHLNDSPVVSTSTTAHSMSFSGVASHTARVATCIAGGAGGGSARSCLQMYSFSALKLLLYLALLAWPACKL